tara:strand:- start:3610 stop:5262 length:1653 start_codon:yes stop_codon:yes gene_type:complete
MATAARRLLMNAGSQAHEDDMLTQMAQSSIVQEAAFGEQDAVERLIVEGANVNAHDFLGDTPLHSACFHGMTEVARTLLEEHAAEIESVDMCGCTPLHDACRHGHVETVTMLLDKGALVGASNEFGNTPLHEACAAGHAALVAVLLGRGAMPMVTNRGGKTPIEIAVTASIVPKDVYSLRGHVRLVGITEKVWHSLGSTPFMGGKRKRGRVKREKKPKGWKDPYETVEGLEGDLDLNSTRVNEIAKIVMRQIIKHSQVLNDQVTFAEPVFSAKVRRLKEAAVTLNFTIQPPPLQDGVAALAEALWKPSVAEQLASRGVTGVRDAISAAQVEAAAAKEAETSASSQRDRSNAAADAAAAIAAAAAAPPAEDAPVSPPPVAAAEVGDEGGALGDVDADDAELARKAEGAMKMVAAAGVAAAKAAAGPKEAVSSIMGAAIRKKLVELATVKAERAALLLKPPPPNKFLKEKKHKVTRAEKRAAKALQKDATAIRDLQKKKATVKVGGEAKMPDFSAAFIKSITESALSPDGEVAAAVDLSAGPPPDESKANAK